MPLPLAHTEAAAKDWQNILAKRKWQQQLQEAKEVKLNEKIRFKLGREIGAGTFAKVFEAFNVDTGEKIAIKIFKIQPDRRQAMLLEQINREIQALEHVRHPNIVSLLGYSYSTLSNGTLECFLFLEYVDGASLDKVILQYGKLSELNCRQYVKQILVALKYIHDNSLIHRDIKPRNMLLNSRGQIKLADFGAAKIADEGQQFTATQSYTYTCLYLAPEVMAGKYDKKVDIWALGCSIVEMLSGREPWSEMAWTDSKVAVYYITQTKGALPRLPSDISPTATDFLVRCLKRDPRARPSVDFLLSHPFIADIDQFADYDRFASSYHGRLSNDPSLQETDSLCSAVTTEPRASRITTRSP